MKEKEKGFKFLEIMYVAYILFLFKLKTIM